MELETLFVSEISQKEKEKCQMISHIRNLIYGINEPIYRKKQSHDMENRLVVAGGRWWGEWDGLGVWG